MEDLAKVMPLDHQLGSRTLCISSHAGSYNSYRTYGFQHQGYRFDIDEWWQLGHDLKARNQINLPVKLMKLVLGLNVHLRSSSHVIKLQDWHVKEKLRTNYHWFSSSQCSSLVKHNSFYLQIQGWDILNKEPEIYNLVLENQNFQTPDCSYSISVYQDSITNSLSYLVCIFKSISTLNKYTLRSTFSCGNHDCCWGCQS